MTALVNNVQFTTFRKKLAEHGIGLHMARDLVSFIDPNDRPAVIFQITGNKAPGTPDFAVAIDYGDDGFGWYPESRILNLDDEVAALVAPASEEV